MTSYSTPKHGTWLQNGPGDPVAMVGHDWTDEQVLDDALGVYWGHSINDTDKRPKVRRTVWFRVLARDVEDMWDECEPGWFAPDGSGMGLRVCVIDPDEVRALADEIDVQKCAAEA